MEYQNIRLAAVLAASAAVLAGCDDRGCRDARGQAVACHHGGVVAGVHGGWGGDADGVARGGFGGGDAGGDAGAGE